MKQIILAATMMAITTGAFAQTQNDENEDFETTEGNFYKYKVYSNTQLVKIMYAANHIAARNGEGSFSNKRRDQQIHFVSQENRDKILDLYEKLLSDIPNSMEAAEKQVLYSSSTGGF